MESYRIKDLTFTYPNKKEPAISHININIEQGEFITLCGKSGCGKSTLLRQLKPIIAPHGTMSGSILFEGKQLETISVRTQSEKIGFVLQNPDNQIVTDKVWHELAFGLESLGLSTPEIRTRVAEMASFFGIQTWFHKKVTELSGGQKQLLNLAAIMVMQPSVLILDEPTSQLDPIAAIDFLETIAKINREFGTTIILTEHRLEEAFPMSDRIIVMDEGKIIADGTPCDVGEKLKEINHDMFVAFPTPMRVYAGIENKLQCPITVRDGRKWLESISKYKTPEKSSFPQNNEIDDESVPIIQLDDIWFRYSRGLPDVIKGLNATIYEGEIYAIVGGNGTGKTTSLNIINGLLKPYRGDVFVKGRNLSDISNKYNGLFGVLPQNPQSLFVKKTVELDLYEMLKGRKIPRVEKDNMIYNVSEICELNHLLSMHPYDLSGGEQQRAALAKVLLLQPQILILDEPTKGLDGHFKEKLSHILKNLQESGVTIIMVSHDIEFCAQYADRCAMFFDGNIVSCDTPRKFFSGKTFYTTSANRMARTILPNAILADDIILAFGGIIKKTKPTNNKKMFTNKILNNEILHDEKKLPLHHTKKKPAKINTIDILDESIQVSKENRKVSKRTFVAAMMILLAIPLTIYVGIFFLGDRKYYFISLLIILETIIPFIMVFEGRKPQARELVTIAVLCALAVAGNTAFFMLPQFKPVIAIVIISGVCFGGETGFLVGATTGFVSNMFVGQGPWTPWQMFSFGVIGFLAGVLFRKGILRKTKSSLCIFGGLATFFIYGGIMNPASVLMWQAKPTLEMFISAYLMGIPFDIIHAIATVTFLWFISNPMIEKLDRIKVKYGITR